MLVVDVIRVQAAEAALSQPLLDLEEFTLQRLQHLPDFWVSPHLLMKRNSVIVLIIIRLPNFTRSQEQCCHFISLSPTSSTGQDANSLPGTCSFSLIILTQCSHQHINTFLI